MLDIQQYYAEPGPMTAIGGHDDLLAGLPDDIGAIRDAVQNVMIHVFWTEAYGVTAADIAPRMEELQIRAAGRMLDRIRELDDRPLPAAREPHKRLLGNCRDFTTLFTALLRHKGIPARARCGFGLYFVPGKYIDHWVAEVWDAGEGRWVMVDSQLDALQTARLGVTFDPLDVPRDQFWTGPAAWQKCRTGQADPDTFGINEMHGLWFVRGDAGRDIAALNKMELLPWDCWGVLDEPDADTNPQALALLDHASELVQAGDVKLDELQALYEREPRLRVPPTIHSYVNGTRRVISLADEVASA